MAAIGFIEAHRQSARTGVPLPDEEAGDLPIVGDPAVVNDVEGFMATASVRQLKLLRKIALGLDQEVITEH